MSTHTYGRCRGCSYAQIITSDTSECSRCGGWACGGSDVLQADPVHAKQQRQPDATPTVVEESGLAAESMATKLPSGRTATRSTATQSRGEQLKLF